MIRSKRMSINLNEYPVKVVVSGDKSLILNKQFSEDIENYRYDFKIFNVLESIMEVGVFIRYPSIIGSPKPIERSLAELIGYSTGDLPYIFEQYRFSKVYFTIGDVEYSLKIIGVGPFALKLVMDVSFSEIENEKGPLEKSLKDFILNFYGIVNKFDSHFQNEFQKNLDKYEKRNLRREKILNEVRKKERKIQAIEEEFGFYTPINKKARYKIR